MRSLWVLPDSAAGRASAAVVWRAPRPKAVRGPGDVLLVVTDTLTTGPASREEVRVAVVAPGGARHVEGTGARGDTLWFSTAAWGDGPCEARVETVAPDGYRVFAHLPWYRGDWRAQVDSLIAQSGRVASDASDPAALRLRVTGDLMRQAMRSDTTIATGAEGWRKVHSVLVEHLEAARGHAGGAYDGGFVRLAWRDEVDGSPQFARAFLPAGYDAARAWPMVVRLHGYNAANPEYAAWGGIRNRHSALAERHGVIWLEPHGRGNTGYSGIGDADVMRAIAEAKAAFRVDEDRVYLSGTSMGGGGTWNVGTRHPEAFAAIGPIYGGWDYRVWSEPERLRRMTYLDRFFAESWSSFCQAEALLTTPIFVNHGDADALVDVAHSRYAVRMVQRWGYDVRYWEHPGKGHQALGSDDETVRWFLRYARVRDPREVRVRAGSLETAAAHWVRVTQYDSPMALIQAHASVVDPGTIRLDTENAAEVLLTPTGALVSATEPVRVMWNGRDAGEHRFGQGGVKLRAEGYVPAAVVKRPALSGPIEDATTTPFAIVAGTTAKDPVMRRFCRLQAERARDGWKTWQKVEPRFFLDTEMTDEQIRSVTLILYGGPGENRVAARLKLPVSVKEDEVAIDGARFAGSDVSVAMVWPHPQNPDRYVVVRTGTRLRGCSTPVSFPSTTIS